jgi:hypothetical protein
MDIHDLHSLVTVLAVLAFAGIVIYAYGSKRKQYFDDLGRRVLDDNDITGGKEKFHG